MAKMNIKKLAADHVEKAVAGILVLVVLLALAGTKWKPYSGTPREITEKVAEGKKALKANVWPEEELKKYTISREEAPANLVNERLRKEFSVAQVEVSGKMIVDPFNGNEPVREPIMTPPQDLIASSARVFINMFDESKLTAANAMPGAAQDPAMPKKDDDADRPDELRKNTNNQMGAGMGMEMGVPQSYGSVVEMNALPENAGAEGSMEMEQKAPELNGEGYHFVSVRAVFPLREQITQYAEAIHKSFHYAASTFDIRNFDLERQTAQPGENPWSGPWEPVDLQMAEDILNKADGFDAEVVNPMITNAVITMPLPMRISGRWDKQATHPRIEKFALSDSEIALEAEMQRKLLMEAVNQQKQMDAAIVKRGGFSKLTVDPRQLNQDVLGMGMYQSGGMGMAGMGMGGMGMEMSGGNPAGMGRNRGQANQADPIQKLIQDMARGATNKKEEEERIRKWIQSLVTAEGELLLFRYLDFNVEPGQTYRYRVRFELANPNYGKRISEAGGLNHVVEGETRKTPWSNITTPVTVEKDVKYYLTDVSERFPRVLPTVTFDVFEWAQKHGTVINAMLDVHFGQQLKQSKETIVIDPAKNLNEKQSFTFKSTDYLVDALDDIPVDEAFHEKVDDGTAIKFPVGTRGRLPLASKVIVANDEKQLRFLSPVIAQNDHARQKNYMTMQAELYEYLKEPEKTEGDEALLGLGLSGEEMPAEGKKKGRGPKSQLRIRGSASAESGSGRRGARSGP